LAEKLAKDQNGADIPDPALFVKNLGLGEAAKLAAAVAVAGRSGRISIPAMINRVERNIIIQWVAGFVANESGVATVSLPLAFPNELLFATAIDNGATASSWPGSMGTTWGMDSYASSKTTVIARVLKTSNGSTWTSGPAAGNVLAIGY
ncbi:hypothetical protein MRO53_24395, partial [Escherichia coli]|nr:hypothetical protein [Escherichia coli]